ncbi:ABC transporter permease [candidate division KSB3 bacterium]|uniref:ABC transporter permease n=1 Tax=candidate division KSB3 bacterium TaxID=2044937 RepID=A0A2G6EF05_9BACT|nr:MAG: ABC transporter permease [candidate division KSB3 bacterium]
MKLSTNLQRLHNRTTYNIWIAVFFLIVLGVGGLIYLATQQIDYVWRWYRVPSYFVYKADIQIVAEIEGEVSAITEEEGDAYTIRITNDDGTAESYHAAADSEIFVSEGDMIYPGDTLAVFQRWKPGIMLQGLWMTLKVSLYAIFLGILIGLIGGIARMSSNPALKWTAIAYVELIRGSPLLVQIFIWYFVLGTLVNTMLSSRGFSQISPLWSGVAALAFFTGAYVTEIVRAGIQSIHKGQIEASRSLGMSYGQSMRYVVLPQAMRRILPPLAGQFISLIKDSSLLGIIAVRELTKATREVITTSLQPFELYFTCALLYLLLTFTLSMAVQYMERRMSL